MKDINGMYYFDETPLRNTTMFGLSCTIPPLVSNKIMFWHKRLGHPSFSYLKHLFLEFSKEISSSQFHCDVCHLAIVCLLIQEVILLPNIFI